MVLSTSSTSPMVLSTSTSFTPDDAIPLWHSRKPAFLQATNSDVDYRRARYSGRHRRTPTDAFQLFAKRTFDFVTASMALLFFAPLLLGVAIAIKATSSGPVLFSQWRYGHRNRRFRIYKFRTMYTHLGDRSGTQQTTSNDPRITPLGRILRNTSLDELPQLINVVKGDMSLVGPRPHVPGMLAAERRYEDLVPYYFHRHALRPGITGLAQVSGCRGSTEQFDQAIARIDYDLQYIETWSLWLDAKIILKTCRREFLSGNGI